MPLYDFKCENCGACYERVVQMDNNEPDKCGYCGGVAKKTMSPTKSVNRLNIRISKKRKRIM